MNRRLIAWISSLALTTGLVLLDSLQASLSAAAQAAATDTPEASAGEAYITNTFEGEPAINVRSGPSTITFPSPCGSLPLGATAPALGASPGHDWVQIAFAGCPGGVGWVYAANVTLSGSVHVVEPPPTPALPTATIDPTLQAQFEAQPTETRLPTFTPPPPLQVPTFASASESRSGMPTAVAILAIVAIGGIVLGASFFRRR